MNDPIDRQTAIENLLSINEVVPKNKLIDKNDVVKMLVRLPSAQRTGRWIVDDEFIDCSSCRAEKWSRIPYESLVKRFRFCPNCGAQMEWEGGSIIKWRTKDDD